MSLLYLAPSFDAALADVQRGLRDFRAQDALAPVRVLLPSGRSAAYVRRRLGATFNVRLETFYDLGVAALDAARLPIGELSDFAIRRLVAGLLAQLAAEGVLTTFRPVHDLPGFTTVIVNWLREVKQQGITPDRIASGSGERDSQLAELYRRYQTALQERSLADTEGLLLLAAEALEADASLLSSPGPCLALGFDQVTPTQRRILAALARRSQSFAVYLPWSMDHPAGSLIFSRLEPTRRQLHAAFGDAAVEGEERVLSPAAAEAAPALARLRRSLFTSPSMSAPLPSPSAPALELIEAPGREDEVRCALRTIKRLLLEGVAPHEIALLAPNPTVYAGTVVAVAAEYGIPVRAELPPAENPFVAAFLSLLDLAPDFPWRATFAALRSPYLRRPWLTDEQVEALDGLTRERPVVAGRSQWAFALQPLQLQDDAVEDEDRRGLPLAARLPAEALAEIRRGLDAFFDHLTPPAQATPLDYAAWVQEGLLGVAALDGADGLPPVSSATLDMAACCTAADSQAGPLLRWLLDALSELAKTPLEAAGESPDGPALPMAWESFRRELAGLLLGSTLPAANGGPAVSLSALEAGRASAVDYLYVLGLSEGEFPASPVADPLYDPAERRSSPLPLMRPDEGDSASVWWQVVSGCRQRLTLLRPWLDESGAEWPPSPYWEETARAHQPQVQAARRRVAAPLDPEEAAGPAELLASLALAGAQEAPLELAARWQAAQAAHRLERMRARAGAPTAFEGALAAPDIHADLARRFGRPWSVSRLNRYNACPFGFYLEYVLKLEPRPDPEEGFDARVRGSMLHAVLERLYRRLAERSLAAITGHREALAALLAEEWEAVCRDAPARYGFRPGSLWRHEQEELGRLARVFFDWECEEQGAEAEFLPFEQELKFGLGGAHQPLALPDSESPELEIHGVIDRIDRSPDGRLRLIDYKSGSTSYTKADIQRGTALQTALYALAAQRLFGAAVVKSVYLHLPNRKESGKISPPGGRVEEDELVQAAVARALESVRRVRSGLFIAASAAEGGCARGCSFAAVCRVTRASRRKALNFLAGLEAAG